MRWAAAAAAVCLAVGAGAAGAEFLDGHPTRGSGRTVALTAAAGQHVSGQIGMAGKPWGTSVTVDLANLPGTGTFTLRATDDRGHTEPAATWGATSNGRATVEGATAVPMDVVSRWTVLDANGVILADAGV